VTKSLAPLAVAAVLLPVGAVAQAPRQVAQDAPRSASATAPVDFTGYWVSPVMEDWRWRMVTPLKGDAASIPLKADARAVVDAWDPAKDEAAGEQCKAYGAPGLLRLPGRLKISWQDDNTLKIETDAGTQTRLLHFADAAPPGGLAPSRQGYSTASFGPRVQPGRPAGVPGLGLAPSVSARSRTLEVMTTGLLPGYLRKNGIPYSDQTTLAEHFDHFSEPDGTEWFTVTTIVTDPVYLGMPFVTTTDFKKEPNGSRFAPSPCSAR
jgi:hypothetical protein